MLVLPPKLNSKLGARIPTQKAEEYYKTGPLVAQEVADILKQGSYWSGNDINERESKVLQWAQQEWED